MRDGIDEEMTREESGKLGVGMAEGRQRKRTGTDGSGEVRNKTPILFPIEVACHDVLRVWVGLVGCFGPTCVLGSTRRPRAEIHEWVLNDLGFRLLRCGAGGIGVPLLSVAVDQLERAN
eukprot:3503035-Pyramimonas_sp.AAC.1